jgi:hypothetical protein
MFMVLDIFFNKIFGYFVPHCPNKVTIFPKFASPQFLFDIREELKNLSCRSPFKPLHYLRNRISRGKSQKYVHMIFSNFHCLYFKIIRRCDFFENRLNKFSKISIQYPFPIFWRPYQMVSCIVNRMTGSFNGHANILIDFIQILKDDVSSPP